MKRITFFKNLLLNCERKKIESNVFDVENDQIFSSAYGIKQRCPLSELMYFKSISAPSDIAHDLCEGFNKDVLASVLKHCVSKGNMTGSEIADSVANFPYQFKDRTNKPTPPIFDGTKILIKQSATQSLCLLKLLPLIIGGKMEDDEIWNVYLQYLDVIDLIYAPELTVNQIQSMKSKIENFLAHFFALNPEVTVRPKAHYMLHYARQYERFGPLIHNTTLRFESVHSKMKDSMRRVKNFRNPCMTMATRYQHYLCHHHQDETFLFENEIICGRKQIKVGVDDFCCLDSVKPLPLANREHFFAHEMIEYQGIQYRKDMSVIIGGTCHNYKFGKILGLTQLDGKVFIFGTKYNTLEYKLHYHAYEVENTDDAFNIDVNSLLSAFPLSVYNVENMNLIVMRHFVNVN